MTMMQLFSTSILYSHKGWMLCEVILLPPPPSFSLIRVEVRVEVELGNVQRRVGRTRGMEQHPYRE